MCWTQKQLDLVPMRKEEKSGITSLITRKCEASDIRERKEWCLLNFLNLCSILMLSLLSLYKDNVIYWENNLCTHAGEYNMRWLRL
jgi:hypothetical protein